MRWTMNVIVACWMLAASPAGRPEAGVERTPGTPGGARATAVCLSCHKAAAHVLAGSMATRAPERGFARRALGADGERFFAGSCGGCHLTGCADCHGARPHDSGTPKTEACVRCHRGYFTGSEYLGRAPREDHSRYQRGPSAGGEHFLKMLPDVHHEAGMPCADCHTMQSLSAGSTAARQCTACHQPSADVPEHAIAAHLEKMECYACHSAWSAQEYGTFLVRPQDDEQRELYGALRAWGPWRKSAYLKRQEVPPLGLNGRGRVSPIRPKFILFATDLSRGWENRTLAAEWQAGFPHTVRRGTTACGGCHDTPRRFLLEPDGDRLYLLEKDGLSLRSFWNRAGQRVVDGVFLPEQRYLEMNRRTPAYVREHLRQWQRLLGPDAPSSKP
jgi:hypothetical protein